MFFPTSFRVYLRSTTFRTPPGTLPRSLLQPNLRPYVQARLPCLTRRNYTRDVARGAGELDGRPETHVSSQSSDSGPRSNAPTLSYDGLVDLEGNPVRPRNAASVPSKPSSTNQTWNQVTSDKPASFQQAQMSIGRDAVLRVSKEVAKALSSGGPVVALETTIYTHGFPYPENVELAMSLESIVRASGAVPATIGIVDGIAVVGLNSSEIKELCARAGDPSTMKVSRRDIPYIIGMGIAGRRLSGGTTVSGTMFIAAEAGISIFGTGGLGGVHRGGQDTMDISADLTELGRTSMAVVSSGCKSFLDLPRTLEFLETQGAAVCTFADGRSGQVDFPSFYTRDSGVKSPTVVRTVEEAAAMIYAQRMFGRRSSGILLANPIPEAFSIPKEEIDVAINQAVREAAEQGFHGHANTPFILSRIKDLTKGGSIPANRALIQSNVKLAAKVAVELARISPQNHSKHLANIFAMSDHNTKYETMKTGGARGPTDSQNSVSTVKKAHSDLSPDILVLGSVALDLSCNYSPKTLSTKTSPAIVPQMHTSNIASITQSIGGVGHNVALAAHRVASGLLVQLQSAVADDLAGKFVLQAMKDEGLDTTRVIVVQTPIGDLSNATLRTAQYVAVNDQRKDLVLAMADMDIFFDVARKHQMVTAPMPNLKWAIIDANWEGNFALKLAKTYKSATTKIAFEPVSVEKAASILSAGKGSVNTKNKLAVFPAHNIDLITPNKDELAAMWSAAHSGGLLQTDEWWRIIDSFGIPSTGARTQFIHLTNSQLVDDGVPLQTIQLLPYFPVILTKLGSAGVLLTELLKQDDSRLTDPDFAQWILSRCTNGSTEVGGVYMRLFPAVERVPDEEVVSVNGVGDTFLGVLVAGLAKEIPLGEDLITIAQKGAVMTLKSKDAVSPSLYELSTSFNKL